MARKKSKQTSKKLNITATVIFILIIVSIAVAWYFLKPLFTKKNLADTSASSSVKQLQSAVQGGAIEGDFKIHFVDVGQGDGIIIQLPDGKNMLVDAGKASNVGKLTTYIDTLGIKTFDYLIATHQDEDHIGGMKTIFDNYQIDYVYRPHVFSTYEKASELPENFNQGNTASSYICKTKTYYTFLQCVVDEGSGWSFFNKDSDFEIVYTVENAEYKCSFDFLTPTAAVDEIAYKNNANDYSPIIIVDYCGYKVMLTGDAEKEAEEELLDFYSSDPNSLDIDLLKVGHHGSRSSSTESFLSVIKPEAAVISCGTGNTYGHPHEETLNKLVGIESAIYRTDIQGSIILTVKTDGSHDFATTITDYNEADLYLKGN